MARISSISFIQKAPFKVSGKGAILHLSFLAGLKYGVRIFRGGAPLSGLSLTVVDGKGRIIEASNSTANIYLFSEDVINSISFNFDGVDYEFTDLVFGSGLQDLVIPSDPCISTIPSNKYNFWQWYLTSSDLPLLSDLPDCNEEKSLPHVYGKMQRCDASYIFALPEEEYKGFLNAETFIESEEASLRIGLINMLDYGSIIDINESFSFVNGKFDFSFSIPDGTPLGVYRLIIYNTDSNSARYISNKINLVSQSDADRYSVLLRNSNFKNRLGFEYESGVETVARIPLFLRSAQALYETKTVEYKEISSGKRRSYDTESEKYFKFGFHGYDFYMSDALQKAVENSLIEINGVRYTKKTNITPIETISKRRVNGDFELYENEFSELNNNNC